MKKEANRELKHIRGKIYLYKYNFKDGGFSVGFGIRSSDDTNLNTKACRIFLNQCVGHPNMTIYKEKHMRDERYEEGKQILLNGGYEIIEESI